MRITLIHALTLSIPPIEQAFKRLWPEANINHLLDSALSADLQRDGELTPAMFQRFETLTRYAVDTGAHGILFTCSAFAPCIDAVKPKFAIPILRPNEAMFEAALAQGEKLGLIASFQPSIESMTPELHAMALARNKSIALSAAADPKAMQALNAGDGTTHDLILAGLATNMTDCDVVMLAQFSTARAVHAVQSKLSCPVLTSPDTAVQKMKTLLA